MSVDTTSIKAGRQMNFGNSYAVTFKAITPSASKDIGSTTCIEMILTTSHGDVYEITLNLNSITIEQTTRALSALPWLLWPSEFRWIPKYMIRPTKWGKAIYELNPVFIQRLWGLVADDVKMRQLANIPKPYKITIPI